MYTTWIPSAGGSQKVVQDSLEMELEIGAAVWVLGIKLQSRSSGIWESVKSLIAEPSLAQF